jgi:signal transduction histidine kinase
MTVLALLVGIGGALVLRHDLALTNALEESLEAEAESLATSETLPRVIPPFVDDDAFAVVYDDDGNLLASTANIEEDDDDRDGYVIVRRRGPGRSVTVAAPDDDIDDSVASLVGSLVIAIPVGTLVLAALVWLVVGRTLQPVEAIRAEVAAIGGRDLHRRVPVPETDDEIGRLARTMNDMLARVEDASARQARFVSDASHELRTPLARMRAELEVDLAHPSTADLAATHRSALEEVDGLQHLVDDLLALAKSDAGAGGARTPVDLATLVVGDDVVHVDATSTIVDGDERALRRAITNLVDNARRHARSRVDVVIADATVSVTDDGDGVPVEHRARIFDRFAQVDESRTGSGTGLGLAIAREIAGQHGGTLTLEGANRFVLSLRATPPAPR